jgi:hypothetical protein
VCTILCGGLPAVKRAVSLTAAPGLGRMAFARGWEHQLLSVLPAVAGPVKTPQLATRSSVAGALDLEML